MKKKHFYRLLSDETDRRKLIEKDLNLRLSQQEVMAYLGEYAIRCRDLIELFHEAARLTAETLEMEYCKVLELQPDGQQLLLREGFGWQEGMVGTATEGAGFGSPGGYTLQFEEPIIVHDLRTETRFSEPKLLADHQVISGMSVSIPGRERPFGVLGVYTRKLRQFHPHDTRFVKGIATILASAVERFHMEEELRRSRDEQEITLNGVTEGITVQNPDGSLAYANQAAADLMGYATAQDAMASPLNLTMQKYDLLDEDGNPFPLDQLPGRLALQGMPRASAKIRFRVKETGEERWSLVDATPVLDDTGTPVQAVNIFRDITAMVRAQQVQQFLAKTGELLSSSLEYETLLTNIANQVVDHLADWCSVHLALEDQPVRLLAAAHKDPSKVALALDYESRFPPDENSALMRVLRTGKPEYYPIITEEMLDATARSPEQRELLRILGFQSAIIIPLIARERTLGTIIMIWAESRHHYSLTDVDLAMELARRASLAMENARLYAESQQLNAELEQRVENRTHLLEISNRRLLAEVEERRKAERSLLKSETMLTSLFESAPDATILFDKNGKIARVNRQAVQIFGYSREELLAISIDQLLAEQHRRLNSRRRASFFIEQKDHLMGSGLEIQGMRKDGSEFPVDITISPVQTEEGELLLIAVRDMTEQRRLQTELAETHRRLFESIEEERLLLSQELHDGPIQDLYGIALYLETVKSMLQKPEDLAYLNSTKETAQSVVQTLRSICGELRPPTLDHFGLEKAIRSHLMRIQEAHPELQIEARLMHDRQLLSDRARLALFRVYQNSISNILRHAHATHVHIDFRLDDQQVHLLIEDDGRGFAMPQRWVELARAGHFGLVGMVERIEALGGHLQVESAEGQGTTIRVSIPLETHPMEDISITV